MTDEQKQNDRFWIANVASLDAYPEPVEIPPLEIYQALQDKRSSFRSGYLAGLNARSRPEPGGLTGNEQKEVAWARSTESKLQRHETQSLLAIIDRLTAKLDEGS